METSRGNKLIEAFFQLGRMKTLFPQPRGLPQGTFYILHGIAMDVRRFDGDTEEPGVRISTISRHTGMSMPAVSQIVNTLEDKGLLERFSNRRDRRAVYVRPTEKGVALVQGQMEDLRVFVDEIEMEFGEENAEKLIELFDRLFKVVERVSVQHKSHQEGTAAPRGFE